MLTAAPAAPKLLDDVGVWPFFERGPESTYIVGSLTADRYITVPASKLPAVCAFMERLDGARTLAQIGREMLEEDGLRIDGEALLARFDAAGLLANGSGPRPGDIERMSATFLRLPIDGFLRGLRKVSALVPVLAWLGVAAWAAALVLFALDPAFRALAAPAAGGGSLLHITGLVALIAPLSVAAHELSHCLVAARRGIRKGTLRVHLYLGVFPMLALKFVGLYTLPARGRLAVWSAGVWANASIAAAALLSLRFLWPGSAALETAATINWMMTILNLAPLLPTDGYFLLTTWTKDPNVRVRAWRWLRRPWRSGARPSWFVVAYLAATIWLLVATLWRHVGRVLHPGAGDAPWQSILSLALLAAFTATFWRAFRHAED
jgi:hypothetical protein